MSLNAQLAAVVVLDTMQLTTASLLSLAVARSAPVLSTRGRWIVRADNRSHVVHLACVNWYGLDQQDFAPGGLDREPLDALAARSASSASTACASSTR